MVDNKEGRIGRRDFSRFNQFRLISVDGDCSWIARETVEGRYLFKVQGTDKSSWMHPDPDFDHSLYEGYANEPDPEFEPKYEALSYV
jgi:hypothetical protein